jgi:hypothetical protein
VGGALPVGRWVYEAGPVTKACTVWCLQAFVEGLSEEDIAPVTFGTEPDDDEEEGFSMQSLSVFRSPAYKRERGMLAEDDEEPTFKGTSDLKEYMAGGRFDFGEADDEDDEFAAVRADRYFAVVMYGRHVSWGVGGRQIYVADEEDEDSDTFTKPNKYSSLYDSQIPQLSEVSPGTGWNGDAGK